MIQRVNFIEKGAYTITYKNMLMFAGLVCVVCLLINGLFVLRVAMLKSKVAEGKKQIAELTIQKEKALAAMQIAQTQSVASAAPLAALFVKMPRWSAALADISKRMPKQIWFEQIRSTTIGERTDMKKLEIAGKSLSHSSIAQFVNLLEDSDLFSNSVLLKSERADGGYSFVVNTDATFPRSEW